MGNHLRNNPTIAIIGPMTNNIGNEARVNTHYAKLDEMHIEAKTLTGSCLGK